MLAYPVNLWLVAKKLKHGMGTERALGKGGADVNLERERLAKVAPAESALTTQTAPQPVHDMSAMNMGDSVSTASKVVVTLLTVMMLAAGVWLAGRYGDFSMRAGEPMDEMQMNNMKH